MKSWRPRDTIPLFHFFFILSSFQLAISSIWPAGEGRGVVKVYNRFTLVVELVIKKFLSALLTSAFLFIWPSFQLAIAVTQDRQESGFLNRKPETPYPSLPLSVDLCFPLAILLIRTNWHSQESNYILLISLTYTWWFLLPGFSLWCTVHSRIW